MYRFFSPNDSSYTHAFGCIFSHDLTECLIYNLLVSSSFSRSYERALIRTFVNTLFFCRVGCFNTFKKKSRTNNKKKDIRKFSYNYILCFSFGRFIKMGIRGLQTFIEQKLGLLENFQLTNCNVLFDGNSIYHQMYSECHLTCLFGGEYEKFSIYCRQLFQSFRQCQIKYVCVEFETAE